MCIRDRLQGFQMCRRRIDPTGYGLRNLPMISESVQRLSWHGVHRVRSDQLLHIAHITVSRVLGAGACPERSLHPAPSAARSSQRLPEKLSLKSRYATLALAIAVLP